MITRLSAKISKLKYGSLILSIASAGCLSGFVAMVQASTPGEQTPLQSVFSRYFAAADAFKENKKAGSDEDERLKFNQSWAKQLAVAATAAAETDPALSRVYHELAAIYMGSKDLSAAVNASQLAVKFAQNPSVRLREEIALANTTYICYWILSKKDDKKDAIAYSFRNAIEHAENGGGDYMAALVDLLDSFGDFNRSIGDSTAAVRLYRQSADTLARALAGNTGIQSVHKPDIIYFKAARIAAEQNNEDLAAAILDQIIVLPNNCYSSGYYIHTVAEDLDSSSGKKYENFIKKILSKHSGISTIDPWFWVIKVNKGRDLFSNGDYITAISCLSSALEDFASGIADGRPALKIGKGRIAEIVDLISQSYRMLGDRDSATQIQTKYKFLLNSNSLK